MLIPIRCFSCAKEISSKWEKYLELIKQGHSEANALNEVGLKRYCCRRMFLGHVDINQETNFKETETETETEAENNKVI